MPPKKRRQVADENGVTAAVTDVATPAASEAKEDRRHVGSKNAKLAGSGAADAEPQTEDIEEPKRKVARGRRRAEPPTSIEVPQIEGDLKGLVAGDGEVGQLGIGEDGENGKPRFVVTGDLIADAVKSEGDATIEKVVRCAAGGMHSLLLTDKGNVYSFGCNDDGALGRATAEEQDCFVSGRVKIPQDKKVVNIAAGNVHSVALTSDGRVLLWGMYRDSRGPFGVAPKAEKPHRVPTDISGSLPEPIVDVSCGSEHTLLLSNKGNIYSMGCGEQGQLGRVRKAQSDRDQRRAKEVLLMPLKVPVKSGRSAVTFDRVWAGRYTSFGRATDGSIWGCGLNNFSQLGRLADSSSSEANLVFSMVRLPVFDPKIRWTNIVGGEQHTLALDENGRVYAMGRVLYGRLGLGKCKADDPDVSELTVVKDLKDVVSIAAGDHTSFAVNKAGTLFSWGQGTNMLGQGDRESADEQDIMVPTPCVSKALKASRVVAVSAGSNHTLCVAVSNDNK